MPGYMINKVGGKMKKFQDRQGLRNSPEIYMK